MSAIPTFGRVLRVLLCFGMILASIDQVKEARADEPTPREFDGVFGDKCVDESSTLDLSPCLQCVFDECVEVFPGLFSADFQLCVDAGNLICTGMFAAAVVVACNQAIRVAVDAVTGIPTEVQVGAGIAVAGAGLLAVGSYAVAASPAGGPAGPIIALGGAAVAGVGLFIVWVNSPSPGEVQMVASPANGDIQLAQCGTALDTP